jgi:hypothetical protein
MTSENIRANMSMFTIIVSAFAWLNFLILVLAHLHNFFIGLCCAGTFFKQNVVLVSATHLSEKVQTQNCDNVNNVIPAFDRIVVIVVP